ncbi:MULTISPECIES: sigma factor-like helix-turn-helix DNA-binding protein [Bradyrhizobium]|uniref:sigma factor-like helix-turn-helix DNA-binding protein n=1 Tax=Bradyrhizobium TaxID=374 RepID=UPI003857D97F
MGSLRPITSSSWTWRCSARSASVGVCPPHSASRPGCWPRYSAQQSHELEYPKNAEVFSCTIDRARENIAEEDEFAGRLAPREREVLLMHEVRGVPLREVALALGIAPTEADRLLASARRRSRRRQGGPLWERSLHCPIES